MRWLPFPAAEPGPWRGTIRWIRATVDPAEDPQAADPTGVATDIALQITEGGNNAIPAVAGPATPMGGPQATAIPIDWPLGTFGSTTINEPDVNRGFYIPQGQRLQVGVALDAQPIAPDATIVVTIEIEFSE